jgi:diguanylate cyclase (GGDEF)-like protein
LGIGLIDADHFKQVNTRYLLPGGDQVLIALAKTLTGSIRGMDTVGRLGGEEFLVVAPLTNTEGAVALGERIRLAVEQMRVHYQGQEIKITVSLGFTVVEAEALVGPDNLIHQAALALAEAKAQGRNRCVFRAIEPVVPTPACETA